MTNKPNLNEQLIDVVGIGNAIVDVVVKAQDSFLLENALPKGSMTLIDEVQAEDLYSKVESGLETSGGSAANTLAALAQLGSKAGFIGRVKSDRLGNIFTNDISSAGALFNTAPVVEGPPTARCLIFVTPDAQRTMCTYLGASVQLEPKDLDLSMIKNSKFLYLEGYLWDNSAAKRAFIAAAETARASGTKVALSLSDSFCVDRHRKSFIELVDNHIDILFANKNEITSLYQESNLQSALEKVKGRCEIAVITNGEEGSVIVTQEHQFAIDSFQMGNVIDTTGAGDLYAAGFLYGLSTKRDLSTCGKIGSICAGHIITQLGSRSEVSLTDLIEKHIN